MKRIEFMDIIVKNKFLFLFVSICISLPFLLQLPNIKTVDNVDYFTLEDDPDVLFYDGIKEIFGNDEFFIISFEKQDLFTPENLRRLKDLTDELTQLSLVREVNSLANINDTIGEDDFFIVQEFLAEIPETLEDLNKLKESALSNPLYTGNFISRDGNVCAIVVSVFEKPNEPGYRREVIGATQKVIEKYKDFTGKVHLAGWTTTNLYLSQYMKKDLNTFIPLTYLFIAIAVALFFRNIWLTLIAMLNVSICMGSTMGLFPMLDITLNNVTTIVPPVVMALALCDTVHIFSHMDTMCLTEYKTKEKAILHILKKVVKPCLLTTVTTAVGFISLYLSDIPPIKEFALIASMGMVFEFVFAFLFLPPVLLLFNEKRIFFEKREDKLLERLLRLINEFVGRQFKIICLAGGFLIVAAIFFANNILVETNLLDYFKKKDMVRVSTRFVENSLAGIGTLDISLTAMQPDAFKEPENLMLLDDIQSYTNTLDGVDKTLSFADFIKDMNQSFNNELSDFYSIPDSKAYVSQYLLLYDSDDIRDFVNESFDHAKITIRLSEHSTREQARIIASLKEYIKNKDIENLNIRITGRALQDVNTIDALVKGQVYSLATAFCIIVILMFFILRSFFLGVLSILPNIFPILLNFGIMGVAGIPLNTATALIAAVAIGIAVDDTIHFLFEFKTRLKQGQQIKTAVAGAVSTKGKAIVLSSFILAIGFGVLIFSLFVPTTHFGILTAVIMMSAVVGDLLLLPSVICFLDDKRLIPMMYRNT